MKPIPTCYKIALLLLIVITTFSQILQTHNLNSKSCFRKTSNNVTTVGGQDLTTTNDGKISGFTAQITSGNINGDRLHRDTFSSSTTNYISVYPSGLYLLNGTIYNSAFSTSAISRVNLV